MVQAEMFATRSFLDTPPKFDEQIPKNDLETCISGFKYVLCIYFGVANPLNFQEGSNYPYESGIRFFF